MRYDLLQGLGFIYLVIMLDAFSRKFVGCMANHLRTELLLDALGHR